MLSCGSILTLHMHLCMPYKHHRLWQTRYHTSKTFKTIAIIAIISNETKEFCRRDVDPDSLSNPVDYLQYITYSVVACLSIMISLPEVRVVPEPAEHGINWRQVNHLASQWIQRKSAHILPRTKTLVNPNFIL